jgi:hypothetical protein
MSINPIPDLADYPHICDAHKNKTLIIFVGAGVSALWGCKRWKEMASALIDACYKRGKLDYWTRESLLTKYVASPRKLITVAKSVLEGAYLAELQETLQVSRKDKFHDLFTNLLALNASYFTTNIDDNLSRLFEPRNVHYDASGFNFSMIKPDNIIHLHGVISKPQSLVMTIDEYVSRYQDKHFGNFLGSTFFNENYCFLFLGYGVDEMEIIDFMVEKYSEEPKSLRRSINRFYVLLPFFQNEESLLKYEEMYFRQINMSVIPYAIDTVGHDQLYEVIKRWRTDFFELDKDEFYPFSPVIERNL